MILQLSFVIEPNLQISTNDLHAIQGAYGIVGVPLFGETDGPKTLLSPVWPLLSPVWPLHDLRALNVSAIVEVIL